MTSPTDQVRSRMSAEQRREQLLDVAKEILGERGFGGVNIEAIARQAGITRPVVYSHFEGLDALLEALFERESERALGQLARVLPTEVAGDDRREALIGALRGYFETVRGDPVTWRLVLMPPEGAPPVLRKRVSEGRNAVVAALAELVAPGLAPGVEPPDPELTARMFSAVADEGARLILTDPKRYPVDRILDHTRWMLDQVAT